MLQGKTLWSLWRFPSGLRLHQGNSLRTKLMPGLPVTFLARNSCSNWWISRSTRSSAVQRVLEVMMLCNELMMAWGNYGDEDIHCDKRDSVYWILRCNVVIEWLWTVTMSMGDYWVGSRPQKFCLMRLIIVLWDWAGEWRYPWNYQIHQNLA